jgi:hypothetical protein
MMRQPSPPTPPGRTERPACWSPPWSTPGRPSAAATRTSRKPCWWSPLAPKASGSTWATSPPTAGRSTAATATRSWSAAKASSAALWRCWAPCCMRPPTASPRPGRPGHQPPGPLPQPPLRHPRPRTRPGGGQRPADRLVGHHRPAYHRRGLRWPARGPRHGAGAVAPPGAPRWRGPRSSNLLAASCGCGRRIRVAKTTLAEAPILCGICQQPFEPVDPDEDSN